jgi:peroxiredoxin Q/BCP
MLRISQELNMKVNEMMPRIILPGIDGIQFDSHSLQGTRYLLTFFRFATCPFCNMRMAELIKAKSELEVNFEIVAIFESNIDHLKKHANKHVAKFPILADEKREYYQLFGVEKSLIGMVKGMLLRLPTLLTAIFRGYIPREVSSRFLTMPLSLLVDEQGVIQTVYQGKDEGDHIPINKVLSFAKEM